MPDELVPDGERFAADFPAGDVRAGAFFAVDLLAADVALDFFELDRFDVERFAVDFFEEDDRLADPLVEWDDEPFSSSRTRARSVSRSSLVARPTPRICFFTSAWTSSVIRSLVRWDHPTSSWANRLTCSAGCPRMSEPAISRARDWLSEPSAASMYLRTSSSIDAPPSVAWREGYPRTLGPARRSGSGLAGTGSGLRRRAIIRAARCPATAARGGEAANASRWRSRLARHFPGAGMGRGLASKRQVESKLRQLIDRLDEAGPEAQAQLARALPDPRVIQMDLPDLDESFWTELSDGKLGALQTGKPDDCDIRMTASSDDLIAMIDGEKSLFSSYLAGHIKVQASLSDLMALRRLL